jgi:hypothetical protein
VTRLSQLNGRLVQSVKVPRYLFGSSKHEYYETGLVIDRFTARYNHKKCPKIKRPSGLLASMMKQSSLRNKGTRDNHRRRLFHGENPRSYCKELDGHYKSSYDNVKSISLVSSLGSTSFKELVSIHVESNMDEIRNIDSNILFVSLFSVF